MEDLEPPKGTLKQRCLTWLSDEYHVARFILALFAFFFFLLIPSDQSLKANIFSSCLGGLLIFFLGYLGATPSHYLIEKGIWLRQHVGRAMQILYYVIILPVFTLLIWYILVSLGDLAEDYLAPFDLVLLLLAYAPITLYLQTIIVLIARRCGINRRQQTKTQVTPTSPATPTPESPPATPAAPESTSAAPAAPENPAAAPVMPVTTPVAPVALEANPAPEPVLKKKKISKQPISKAELAATKPHRRWLSKEYDISRLILMVVTPLLVIAGQVGHIIGGDLPFLLYLLLGQNVIVFLMAMAPFYFGFSYISEFFSRRYIEFGTWLQRKTNGVLSVLFYLVALPAGTAGLVFLLSSVLYMAFIPPVGLDTHVISIFLVMACLQTYIVLVIRRWRQTQGQH